MLSLQRGYHLSFLTSCALAIAVTLVACAKDDDKDKKDSALIPQEEPTIFGLVTHCATNAAEVTLGGAAGIDVTSTCSEIFEGPLSDVLERLEAWKVANCPASLPIANANEFTGFCVQTSVGHAIDTDRSVIATLPDTAAYCTGIPGVANGRVVKCSN